jgi:hypothetical protein
MTSEGKRLLANFLATDDSTMAKPMEMTAVTGERGR